MNCEFKRGIYCGVTNGKTECLNFGFSCDLRDKEIEQDEEDKECERIIAERNKRMTIETIDNVLHYVWRAGDELPKYQPIGCERYNCTYEEWNEEDELPKEWGDRPHRWPKLLNDRAQHQRIIDEAFEKVSSYGRYDTITYHLVDSRVYFIEGNNDKALDHLAKAGAYVKRMMEYVQEQIDKEESKV